MEDRADMEEVKKPTIKLTKRQQNIVRRMAAGERYYSKYTPRMTEAEFWELSEMGFPLQGGSLHGGDTSGGREYFPLQRKREIFMSMAKEALGLTTTS